MISSTTKSEPVNHGDVRVKSFTFNPFSTNSFVVSANGEALIVDASGYNQADSDHVTGYVQSEGLKVVRLILTHAHIDHIFDCVRLSDSFDLNWELSSKDVALLTNAAAQASMFGVDLQELDKPVSYLTGGETITLGGQILRVAEVPGHSPGSIALIDDQNGYVLSGDVLFQNSIGRTDLWQGDFGTLMRSIHDVLLPLADDTVVYSGHGPATTIGDERSGNPFLNG